MTDSKLAWPSEVVRVSDVCDWIASVFPNHPQVTGPIAIYTASDWGIAARFTVATQPASCDVVLKVCPLALYRSAPHVYELLMRLDSPHVPQLIAWTHRDEQSWMLFRPMSGQTVWATKQPSNFVEMARVLGMLQAKIAEIPINTCRFQTTPVEHLPAMFDAIVVDIETTHMATWEANERSMARRYGLPENSLEIICQFRSDIQAWTHELASGDWPLSLDHVDCHANNAFVQTDGTLVIYDWDEAILSCPFFSLDRLLDSAHNLDAERRLQQAGQEYSLISTEQQVRQMYVDTVPWQTRQQRERAIDLAISLAPIKTCFECAIFAQATGWAHMPMVAAWHIGRTLPRWNALHSQAT